SVSWARRCVIRDSASYMIFGTELSAGHHNEKFDFDESVMTVAVDTLARVALNFPWQRGV
ncbi:hypothetical protein CWN76_29130, partial [Klebsiella quasipneumoniae]